MWDFNQDKYENHVYAFQKSTFYFPTSTPMRWSALCRSIDVNVADYLNSNQNCPRPLRSWKSGVCETLEWTWCSPCGKTCVESQALVWSCRPRVNEFSRSWVFSLFFFFGKGKKQHISGMRSMPGGRLRYSHNLPKIILDDTQLFKRQRHFLLPACEACSFSQIKEVYGA